MRAIKFAESNITFRAEGCHDLPGYNDGKQTVTCWEMDAEDFNRFLSGEKIYLAVLSGDSIPPVQVFVGKPTFLINPEKDIDSDKKLG